MPDDTIFDPGTATATPEAKPNGADPAKEGSPPPGDTVMAERLETLATQVESTNATVAQLSSALTAALQQPAAETPTVPESADDLVTRLATQPKETIEEVAREVYNKSSAQRIEPMLSTGISGLHTVLVGQHKSEIDTEFGPGTWDKVFQPALGPVFQNMAKSEPQSLADPDRLKAQITLLKGEFRGELNDRETAHTKKTAEERAAERAEIVATLPSPGIKRTNDGTTTELTDDAKLFISETDKSTGSATGTEYFVKLLNSGNTLADWQAIQPKEEK